MPLFGYSQADLDAARRQGRKQGEEHVYRMWCATELTWGRKPPLFCPEHIIQEVRAERKLQRAGF